MVKVIGARYELNDPYICVIGKLVQNEGEQITQKPQKKKPIKILGGFDGGDNGDDVEDSDDDEEEEEED